MSHCLAVDVFHVKQARKQRRAVLDPPEWLTIGPLTPPSMLVTILSGKPVCETSDNGIQHRVSAHLGYDSGTKRGPPYADPRYWGYTVLG